MSGNSGTPPISLSTPSPAPPVPPSVDVPDDEYDSEPSVSASAPSQLQPRRRFQDIQPAARNRSVGSGNSPIGDGSKPSIGTPSRCARRAFHGFSYWGSITHNFIILLFCLDVNELVDQSVVLLRLPLGGSFVYQFNSDTVSFSSTRQTTVFED